MFPYAHRGLLILTVGLLAVLVGCKENNGQPGGDTNDPFAVFGKTRDASERQQSANNLKQIVIAMHNYESSFGHFPQAAIFDRMTGKPLLSWRVAILPFIEHEALYKQFKLDEPWDSTHNMALLSQMPKTYRLPKSGANPNGTETHYRVFVTDPPAKSIYVAPFTLGGGPGVLNNKRTLVSFVDGTSNTILVTEAEEGVPWTKPEGIPFDDKTLPKLPSFWEGRFHVAFGDGSVRLLPTSIDTRTFRALVGYQDGEAVQIP
jgi:hypothetical protein